MRTVKEILMELNEDRLCKVFFEHYGILEAYEYEEERNQNKTIGQFRKERIEYAKRLISRLKQLEPKRTAKNERGVFFVYELKHYKEGLCFPMTTIGELKKHGIKAMNFAYEIERQEKILGWYIAETQMTKKYIYDLLADILFEMSFFGIKQEGLKEFYQRLDMVDKETVESKTDQDDDFNYKAEMKIQDDVLYEAIYRLEQISKEREAMEVLKIIKKELY